MSDRVYLYITPFFPSPTTWRGGYCLDAAKALIRDGRFDVRVITFGGGADYEWDGVKVASVRRIVAPSGIFPFWINVINNWLLKKKLIQMLYNILSLLILIIVKEEMLVYLI